MKNTIDNFKNFLSLFSPENIDFGRITKIYSTVEDLPSTVKKLDPKKQRQWMAVWNSAYKKDNNEESAFKQAWGVVNKAEPDPADLRVDSLALENLSEEEKKKLKKTESELDLFIEVKKSTLLSEGLVYGIVYEPLKMDAHEDWTSAAEIQKMAHSFLPSALRTGIWTDKNHKEPLAKNDVDVVESYIAPVDFTLDNGESITKGSWVLVAKVNSEELRKAIEDGEITGFSLEGKGLRVTAPE